MKFLVDLTLGNDAMQTPADVNAALGRTFTDFVSSESFFKPLPEGARGTISDVSGNTVGRWLVIDEERLASVSPLLQLIDRIDDILLQLPPTEEEEHAALRPHPIR